MSSNIDRGGLGAVWPGVDGFVPTHAVQFYERDEYLATAVAAFLADGLAAGQPAVVIATKDHRAAFSAALAEIGFDASRISFFDAREILSSFMDGAMPNEERFRENVGGILQQPAAGSGTVRAFGEMVDLLWCDGNPEAALRLEELWNGLATSHSFSLLCAYSIGNFYKESDGRQFDEVCGRHAHVIPAESFTPSGDVQAQFREISRLQQRAKALTAEIEHRKELEIALREALAARRRAEDSLRQSETELKDFIENAPVGMHWVGADGTILWANEAELKLLGYSREEYIGRNIANFHADRAAIDDILLRLSRNEEIHDYETDLIARDGSMRHVAISSNVRFEEGQFIHTRCFTRDITDRKRLDAGNAFLLHATNALNSSFDADARLREVANLAVPQLADFCSVDLIGGDGNHERFCVERADADLATMVPPDARAEVLRSGNPRTAEDHQWMIVPIRVSDRILGAITFVSAKWSRRYSPADLAIACEFGRRAAIAVENARHYQAAQEANRAKDQFLATLSHELRTPLTAILGWARMLKMGGLDSETVKTAFDTIERSATAQAAIIDDLLDLSRVVTGKLKLRNELVDLATIVSNTVETLRLAAVARDIHLDVQGLANAHPRRLIVAGDPTRLQQIAWNLVSNAIKFSDKDGHVSIALEAAGENVRLVVRDTGRGISCDFLPHVFEAFRQADGASTRSYNGLGLGLAIVKYLSEAHGGTVTANSAGEGQGATFTVTLPLANRLSAHVEPDHNEVVDLRHATVLLVDDDADTRDLVVAILRRCGAVVHAVESVRAASELFETVVPTIVVSDIAMPDQDGFALVGHIRSRREATRHFPIIALTASGDPKSEEHLLAAGFDGYVQKPVDPLHLARVIAKFSSQASGLGPTVALRETASGKH